MKLGLFQRIRISLFGTHFHDWGPWKMSREERRIMREDFLGSIVDAEKEVPDYYEHIYHYARECQDKNCRFVENRYERHYF